MAEKVYIDRNTVVEKLNAIGGCGADPGSWAGGWDKAIEEAINIVNSVPSENAVEVVRCKDCKYAHHWYGNDDLGNTAYLCKMLDTKMYYADFCSHGRRKENGNV